jgi:hypothetical protein
MEVRLTLVDANRIIEIPTADGVLRGPEHLIEILDLAGGPGRAGRVDEAEPAPGALVGAGR